MKTAGERLSKYKICEFGGNTVVKEADTPLEAVIQAVNGYVKVYPDGYVLVDGEPFGWVMPDE